MNASIVYWIVFIMSVFCAFIVIMILVWNSKSIRNKEKIQRLELEKQIELLKASIEGQELERKRIAENLHDDIGPLLSALKLQMHHITSNPELVKNIRATLDEAVQSIRDVSFRMSPSVLEELGLFKSVQYVTERLRDYSDLKINLLWDESIQGILTYQEGLSIYRIIQEAFTNVIRHANATEVSLVARITDEKDIIILIKDNGQGIMGSSKMVQGLGVKNMHARAESINGNFSIDSTNKGTQIQLILKSKHND